MAMSEAIWVGMRLRPRLGQEVGQPMCITVQDNVVSVVGEVTGEASKDFAFDVAMDSTDPKSPSFVSQEKCYELMGKRMLEHMLQGYNTCLFCYGQTGTGKTTTIMGKAQPASEQGLLLRLINDIYEEVARHRALGSKVHVCVQMLEVYNERLNDLIAPAETAADPKKKKIDVHVHPDLGVYLTGATETAVDTAEECVSLIEYGNTMKTVHATAMNAQSSRGHTVFKLRMERSGGTDNMTISSEVYFADLAGRENERTTQVTGDRLVELSFINRSLMWLATCIQSLGGGGGGEANMRRRRTVVAMSAKQKGGLDMAKFRNSKLTLLLSNALSGNSRTAMIGTLSPALANFEESLSTLKFASTVKTIKLEAKAATAVDKESLVKKLEDEVAELKRQLEQAREKQDVEDITSKLEATEAIAKVHARDWTDVEKESAEHGRMRSLTMERLGRKRLSANCHDETPLPYLANYSEDPHLAFKLVLHVPPDEKEHSMGSGEGNDFRLPPGLGVCPQTCFVVNRGGKLWIRAAQVPYGILGKRPASVEVNFSRLGAEPVELKHLDCILFGRSTTFYAFLEPTSAEALAARVWAQSPQEPTEEVSAESLLPLILGDERSSDPLEAQLAREYYSQLHSRHLDSEGAAILRAFMLSARRARKKVEEANDITESVKPHSGLSFELLAQAPVLSFGFMGTGHVPELSVRLVRRVSAARARWKLLENSTKPKPTLSDAVHMSKKIGITGSMWNQPPATNAAQGSVEVLYTWSWAKFSSRLELMHAVYEAWQEDQSRFTLDPQNDPWAEHGPGELAQLEQEHQQQLQDAREKIREREKELSEVLERERRARLENDKLRQELEAARAQLQVERAYAEDAAAAAAASALALGRNGGRAAIASMADAAGRVGRCLELSKSNRTLLRSLFEELAD